MSGDDLPNGWLTARLSDLVPPRGGIFDGPFGSHLKTADYKDAGVRVIRLENLANLEFVSNKVTYIAPDKYQTLKKHTVEAGDILFGSFVDGLPRVCVLPKLSTLAIAKADCFCIRPWPGLIDRRYLMYQLGRAAVRDELVEEIHGVTRPRVTTKQLLDLDIVVPPLAEQRRIVEKVEAVLREVDAARARLVRVRDILKVFRQSVLAAACSGRLTEDWREGHQKTEGPETLLARIRSVKPRFGKASPPAATPNEDAEADRAELPQEWMWCRVADVATVCLGGTPSRKESAYWGGTIPWVSSGEVANCRISDTREKISSMGLENSNAKIYPRGTVLIAMIGEGKTRGQSAILDIEACTNQNAAGLVFDIDGVNPEYVWRWALGEYERTRDVGRGGNQPALNGQKVRELVLPLPPPAEQHEIVRRVDDLFALADVIEARVAAATARADKLTQSILAKAFRGELVTTEAELARQEGRDYEPASALLERIRAVPPGESGPERRPRGRARARAAA